jgi:hypothetical protein
MAHKIAELERLESERRIAERVGAASNANIQATFASWAAQAKYQTALNGDTPVYPNPPYPYGFPAI